MRKLQTTCVVMFLGLLVVHCSSSEYPLPPTDAGGKGGGGSSSAGQAGGPSSGGEKAGAGGSVGEEAPSGGAGTVSAGSGGESGEGGSGASVSTGGKGGEGGDAGAGTGGSSGPGGGAGGEDSSGGVSGAAGGVGGDSSSGMTGNAAFAAVRAVFDLRCAGCHNGTGNGAARVKLSAVGVNTTPLSDEELYAALTNPLPNTVPSCAGGTLVVPGNLDNSQLISKLNDDAPTCGAPTLPNNRMPRGTPACSSTNTTNCLTTEQLAAITTWITAGAPH